MTAEHGVTASGRRTQSAATANGVTVMWNSKFALFSRAPGIPNC